MALIECPDCGKNHSDAAPACPNCGRPNPAVQQIVTVKGAQPVLAKSKVSIGQVVLLAVLLLVLLGSYMTCARSVDTRARIAPVAGPTPAVPTAPAGPQLELLSWKWSEESGYASVEGQVKNISASSLKSVAAVATFYDDNGAFITSDDALIDFNPILPQQTSPFTVMKRWRPEMRKATIQFKELTGGTIPHSEPAPAPPQESNNLSGLRGDTLTLAGTNVEVWGSYKIKHMLFPDEDWEFYVIVLPASTSQQGLIAIAKDFYLRFPKTRARFFTDQRLIQQYVDRDRFVNDKTGRVAQVEFPDSAWVQAHLLGNINNRSSIHNRRWLLEDRYGNLLAMLP